MASNLYIQRTADGKHHLARRSAKQGRKSSGLAKPRLVRLYEEDEELFIELKEKLGIYFNENQIIRDAVAGRRSVYTEFLKQ